MNKRPVIFALIRTYLPGYLAGGPIRSLHALVELTSDEFCWRIVTEDHDLGIRESYPGVVADEWVQVGAAKVYYMKSSILSPIALARVLNSINYDALYINSFFDPKFAILPVLVRRLGLSAQRPILIAPRGEFSIGAYALKAWKKRLYVYTSRLFKLYEKAKWHASTVREEADIMRCVGASQRLITIARDLRIVQRPIPVEDQRMAKSLRVCFLSRVCKMKNLDFALRVLRRVDRPVMFSIYGPIEDLEYWRECQAIAATLPNRVTVEYRGEVTSERVVEVLSAHDVFFVPTRGENFGHVFVEAWMAGLMVLTSDQTPWGCLDEKEVGWDLALSREDEFARVLNEVARWDTERWRRARQLAQNYAENVCVDADVIDANRVMFRRVIAAD